MGVVALAGCSWGAVDIEPYEAQAGSGQVCHALVEALPDLVGDAVARDVDPDGGLTAAWGDPAVILRCGVPAPAEYRPDAQVFDVDGVEWLPVEGDGGYFFTTIDREVYVEVAVPDDYAPEATVLTDLAEAIQDTVPAVE